MLFGKHVGVRADILEWMDGNRTEGELRAYLADLERVNRTLSVHSPTLRWLAGIAFSTREPVHIVDVGCGSGDGLRAIEAWAVRQCVRVRLTGIDTNAEVLRIAKQCTSRESSIRYLQGDVICRPSVGEVDVFVSSHLMHHLFDEQIVSFLTWMETTARLGWFANDLHRGVGSVYAFRLLSFMMRWHPHIRNDGLVSILRSFRPIDWVHYLALAGIKGATITNAPFGRLCVGRYTQSPTS